MTTVVFVAPFGMETTLRFVRAVAQMDGVRLAVVSQEDAERLPGEIRERLAAHWRVADALDPAQLVAAVRSLAGRLGAVHRLLGVLEQLQVPLAEARERLGIPGMGAEVARNFRDKARMKTALAAAGVPCARHRLAADRAGALDFAGRVGFPLVLKPPAGAGAKATFRVDGERELAEALDLVRPSAAAPVLLEEFLLGQEQSFDSVFVGGRPVWHSFSHYLPTPLEVLRNPWIQWCVLLPREIDAPLYQAARQVAVRALEVLGMETGLSHMEWFRRADGSIAVSEVGARPPGAQISTLLCYAHDFDFYRGWARLMVTGEFTAPARPYAAGAAYLRGQGDGRVRAVHGLEEAQREVGSLVVEAKLPRLGQPASGTYEGEGYVIVRHPETRVVEEALRRIVSRVRVELG